MKIKSATYLTKHYSLVIQVEGNEKLLFPDGSQRDSISISGVPNLDWARKWVDNMGFPGVAINAVEV